MTATLTQDKPIQPVRTKDFEHRPDRRLLIGYLHKTSNTLCGIKGYASLIADRENAAGKAGLWARKILLEVERMEEIFRSVGDLNRGRRHPDTEVYLSGFVAETASTCAGDLGGLELVLGTFPDGELRLPAADLAMMLKELLLNCAESAGLDSPSVRVEINGVTLPVGRIFLEIQDNGSGMDAELAAQAANPFTTTKEEHLGVGLTRVSTLMDMYGLDWSLESEEGRGTRVLLEVAEAI